MGALLQLLPLALVGAAYARRARTLARRGTPVPRGRIAWFALGLGLVAVALAPAVEELGARTFTFHMAQHVLLGDLAALALVAGLTGPLLRPLLAVRTIDRLRVLAHPLVALPLWAANLFVWHLPALYEGALRCDDHRPALGRCPRTPARSARRAAGGQREHACEGENGSHGAVATAAITAAPGPRSTRNVTCTGAPPSSQEAT